MKTRLQFRTFYGLIMSFFLLLSISSYSQTSIYSEDFTGQNGKGQIGSTNDISGVNWTIDVSDGSFSNSSDFFGVQNEVFEGQDVDGDVFWQSQTFSISGFNNISISLDAKATGDFEAGTDLFNIDIVVDGVSENIYTGTVDENVPNDPFFFNGTELTATLQSFTKNITSTGNNAYLIISVNNNSGSEIIGFDNLLVEGISSGGNIPPSITNISQSPVDGNVTSSDAVSVSSEVTDSDGINSVELNWGTTSGNLSNTINMSVSSGNMYITDSDIPAQADGTTVYYEIEAIDNNGSPATTVSSEQSYTVQDPIPAPDLIISEVADPGDQFEARFVELYNNGSSTIDLAVEQITLVKYTNDSNTSSSIISLTGTLAPGEFYVIANNQSDFNSAYGSAPDLADTSISGNGDDTYALYVGGDQTTGTLFDIYGEIGTDGTGEPWEYEDSRAYRNDLSTSPNDNWNASEWTIEPADVADMTPGEGEPVTYTYNGSWSPANPVGNAATTDNIEVISGSVEIDQNIEVNDVTISAGATLEISANLIANGDITNNGDLIFKSTSIQNTGTLGPINATSSITNVTVERFIPAKRAFRFISSSVTTSSSINENWQENQHNTGTNFPSDNENSNDGFGTHITGSTTGANGFDATPSGNPSLFMFDNLTQTWNAVSNTDSNSLTAGEPYRLMVRGSRALDVTDNEATATDTRLRTTGNLVTGTQTFSNLTDDVNEFNFVGNPYQAVVNMNSVLSASTNIDANEYYIWDPNKGTRGGYVTVALPAGTNSDGSAANEYLQPNQAFFVAPTGGANPEIVFEESHKVVDNLTSVFNEDEDLTLSVQLVALTNSEELLTDSFMVLFNNAYSNSYNEKDASKIGNLDENIALVNGSKILSVERRNIPTANDSLAFYNNNYRFSNYNLKIEVPHFEDQVAVLYDDYLKSETTLAEDLNTVNFNVDPSIEESVKTNRFSIYFRNKTLSTKNLNPSNISLYPNPFKEGNLTIQTSLTNDENIEVGIYNMLGEQVFLQEEKVSGQHQIQLQNLNLESGVYIVRINSAGKLSSKKLIIE